jgi:hypothetical protein
MATNFPSALDQLSNPTGADSTGSASVRHSQQHANANDAIEALQAKVGVDGSAVSSSIDARMADVESVAGAALPSTAAALGTLLASASEKTAPIDADTVLLSDSAASGVAKKVQWRDVKKMSRAQARAPWRFRGKLLIAGDSTSGWVGQAGVSVSVVTKPAGGRLAYRTNENSVLRIVTSTNTYRSATATVATGPVTTPRVDLWIYLEDPSTIVDMSVFFATSDAFTAYYNKTITPRMFSGWQCIPINLATAAVTGSPTYETITKFRIQIQSTTTAGTSILFDSAWICPDAKSKCALIWDDGQAAEYTHTMAILNKYSLVGNFAIYDTPARLEQWKLMSHSGHKLIVHGTTNLSTLGTLQAAKNAITADAAWVAALGGPGCDPDVYVWPNGIYMYTAGSLALPEFLAEQGFVGGFATQNFPIVPELGIDPYILHRLEINASTVASTWLTALDAHLEIGLCFALCAHVTVDSGATGDQINRSVLDDILSGLRTRINAGSLDCVSARDLILHLTEQ